MSKSVFLLFLRYRFFNYNASVSSGSTWKFNRKQRKFYILLNWKNTNLFWNINEDKQTSNIHLLLLLFIVILFSKERVSIVNGICISLYNGKIRCLKSGHNFGYLEATDISKFGWSPPKFEILIFHCTCILNTVLLLCNLNTEQFKAILYKYWLRERVTW